MVHNDLYARGPWFVARLCVTVTVTVTVLARVWTVVASDGFFEGFCEGLETADGPGLAVVGVDGKIMPQVTAAKADLVATSHSAKVLCDDPIDGQE